MTLPSRRDCLKSAFTIIPALSGRTYAANEKLNVAVVGCGSMGMGDIGRMVRLPINIVALCDVDSRDPVKRNPSKGSYDLSAARTWVDFREMLDKQKDIEAVFVATPDHMPAFPPTISRPSRCRSAHCLNMPVGGVGRPRLQVKEVGSGASERQLREKLLEAARRRDIDVVLVWRLDRRGRSVADLAATLQELGHLGVGFVSITEALDLTTPAGRALAGLFASLSATSSAIAFEPAWRIRGRTASGWAGRQRRPYTPLKSENYTAPASANPRSPSDCRSAAPRVVESWEQCHEKTQARPRAGRPHPQRGYRRCRSG